MRSSDDPASLLRAGGSADQLIHNNMNLQDTIKGLRVRKGAAAGIDDTGEYWIVSNPPLIHCGGGDGIGNSSPDRRLRLQLRHYRSGHTEAVIRTDLWHQNQGSWMTRHALNGVLEATTVAEVIAAIRAAEVADCGRYLSDTEGLRTWLTNLGFPAAAPGPDEGPGKPTLIDQMRAALLAVDRADTYIHERADALVLVRAALADGGAL